MHSRACCYVLATENGSPDSLSLMYDTQDLLEATVLRVTEVLRMMMFNVRASAVLKWIRKRLVGELRRYLQGLVTRLRSTKRRQAEAQPRIRCKSLGVIRG
jgi:hypothetical protein